MNGELFEQLLNEEESSSLDFKQAQYKFNNATKEEKSELLKDILAFANAWRRTDAYILIGVEEVKGDLCNVFGIVEHIDDANLQQFVNQKTNKPIEFSYKAFNFGGKQVGIIHIPVQERPLFLLNKFGKLHKNDVYIRRGSSTDIANPDEIIKMGLPLVEDIQDSIILDLQMGNIINRELLGKKHKLISKALSIDELIPDFNNSEFNALDRLTVGRPNRHYYRELVNYFQKYALLRPISFVVRNMSGVTIFNPVLKLELEHDEGFLFDELLPEQPKKYIGSLAFQLNYEDVGFSDTNEIEIQSINGKLLVEIPLTNIQPKAHIWTEELYVGTSIAGEKIIRAQLFGDNIPNPTEETLNIEFEVEQANTTIESLENILQESLEEVKRKLLDDYENNS